MHDDHDVIMIILEIKKGRSDFYLQSLYSEKLCIIQTSHQVHNVHLCAYLMGIIQNFLYGVIHLNDLLFIKSQQM